jgi:hypothetical protein
MDKSRETLKKWHHMMVTVTFITFGHRSVTSLTPRSQEKQVFVDSRETALLAGATSALSDHNLVRPRLPNTPSVSRCRTRPHYFFWPRSHAPHPFPNGPLGLLLCSFPCTKPCTIFFTAIKSPVHGPEIAELDPLNPFSTNMSVRFDIQ